MTNDMPKLEIKEVQETDNLPWIKARFSYQRTDRPKDGQTGS